MMRLDFEIRHDVTFGRLCTSGKVRVEIDKSKFGRRNIIEVGMLIDG